MAVPSPCLPEEAVTCLKNARFLHLATCTGNVPHITLMHFSYLPPDSFPSNFALPSGPVIIMTTAPQSKKMNNILSNPNASLLVHDWVSARPPFTAMTGADGESNPAGGPSRSSLAQMLMEVNSASVSSISATINGNAMVLERGSEEERWCKEQHLANNASAEVEARLARSRAYANSGVGGRGDASYIDDSETRVVVVQIRDGRISDWKGGITEWAIEGVGPAHASQERMTDDSRAPLVNGAVSC